MKATSLPFFSTSLSPTTYLPSGSSVPSEIIQSTSSFVGLSSLKSVINLSCKTVSYDGPSSFKGLVKKLQKEGKSKEAATKIAGKVANYKRKGGGKGPTAKQKARMRKK